ncbi:tetratricopeptide repeat protein [Streptomyces mirabilis]|uniref:Tetratricopeptide repeat protein n=1 Tax=Streptomyces mirabilis TaxID=68239 RepID=A0ABU3V5X0_9ACTN|nr:tetratricopeptide repeat protein [Streptomyces mirabilis]MDU9001184.1 tetratricopeptide repeat protein [Streptomyces mirabilis]
MGGASGGVGGSVSNTISGGVFFHAVIQGRDITVQLPPQITPALSGLPPASPTFTGRDTDVDQILQGLAPDSGARRRPVLVAAVAGLAGVGKTELVIQTATRALKEPGWFPGGVLFVDLFGYDTELRLSPEHALDGLLRALGMPGEHIPASLQDRARLYRSVLAAFAEQGRRILVVIDNASTAEQARPLLPSDGTTVALLTSRHTLDVDARLHDLDILDEPASIELLRDALHQARGSADNRVADDPEAAAAIARLCAGLPLALRIAAGLLADAPTRPLASLARALEAEHSRLDRLHREDGAVRAAFDLSYQHLDDLHARLFRLLPLNPGPDLSTETAAHLADVDQFQVEELLQDLARAHLIEPGHVWSRWRLHDLVRLYADERAVEGMDPGWRGAALTRLLEHYATTAKAADDHLRALPGQTTPEEFTGREAALSWLDAERANLVGAVTIANGTGHPDIALRLPSSLVEYLGWRRLFDDWITTSTIHRDTAHATGDDRREAAAWNNLGTAFREVRRFDEAITALEHARDLFRRTDDRRFEARAWDNLGLALQDVRRFDEAITAHTHARDIHHDLGDDHREATAWGNLGVAFWKVGRFDEAITAHTQARELFEDTDDHHGVANAWNDLGLAFREVGRIHEAITAHSRARELFEQTGDQHSEGRAWMNLGLALEGEGRIEEAIAALRKDIGICRATGDLYGAAVTWQALAKMHTRAGQVAQAQMAWEAAATAYQDAGAHGEAERARANTAAA